VGDGKQPLSGVIGTIIPETYPQTTAARRKRFRHALEEILAPKGWVPVRPNIYKKQGAN
jgi:hypothetical protein